MPKSVLLGIVDSEDITEAIVYYNRFQALPDFWRMCATLCSTIIRAMGGKWIDPEKFMPIRRRRRVDPRLLEAQFRTFARPAPKE